MYDIVFNEDVENDLMLLSDTLLNEVLEYFEKFKTHYLKYSLPLFDKDGRDLKGCRKTYFGNTEYRIV